MKSESSYNSITDGTYVLTKVDEYRFIFYRKDHGVLGYVGRIPMDLYHSMLALDMFSNNTSRPIIHSIEYDRFDDGTRILMTIISYDEEEVVPEEKESKVCVKESKISDFFKKIFKV